MMDGKQYLDSLKDGRAIYLNGEKVDDVTTHPAYRNAARSIAKLYDALHDPAKEAILTTKSEFGFRTHKFFKASTSSEELLGARDAMAEWTKLSYGFMGRTPDYKAAFTASLGPYAYFYKGFEDNARRWYKKAQQEIPFCNHTIVNPQLDRDQPLHKNKEVFVRAVEERDDGVIVSGAKMVGTSAALTHYNFVANYSPQDLGEGDKSHALIFFVPMNAPGLKVISRQSYEETAAIMGTPFDYPLSSRFDENDAVIVLDNVFIPWEDVLTYNNVDIANGFRPKTGWLNRYTFQGCTRFAVKLDFMVGLLLKATEMAGTNKFRGVQANIGEVISYRNMFWAISEAMAANPETGPNGVVLPNATYATAYRTFAPSVWPKIKQIFEQVVAGGLIQLPSSAKDFQNLELRPYLDHYYKGSGGVSAEERVKVLKLIWDAIGTEFGGRNELYEINYAGNHEGIRLDALKMADNSGQTAKYKAFVEQALSDYDLTGWTSDTWINPDKHQEKVFN
ncbi:4-hydroxyphenylacetate 3-hydroxylase family protein [Virgibacillus salexigens]|uniref:4-nitrophenol 2-monooxygenase, oxygenase component n=2 Tax=Virgibacillus TaxID=84406 RepID=A0A024QDA1_9BACI|nr:MULTISPECIES: 4-hydroxyphenylacetate 3-hydroxylase N-terminal domain-containing protein [Virgibacillus]MYL42609.1 Pyoverdin chromophore biosynthetic protein pvcC [Virgibacillus massiliensis]GGJ73679.1 pyoverdin chromophore biosynthetic protein pvcC [Virgibacillus kapii]CDQ40493.1 4-nitrophenol 2-monooxygenase, oxygenase component [Virgibacillus massiliensis]